MVKEASEGDDVDGPMLLLWFLLLFLTNLLLPTPHDRPGMATGLAVCGFGGGAMIGGPMFVKLMKVRRLLSLNDRNACW